MVLTLLGVSFQTLAYEDCRERGGAKYDPPIVNLRIDNDLFGAEQQDQGYSHGFGLTLVSPNLVDYTDDPCLPRPARWLNRHLERLAPDGFEQQNMVVSFGQAIYTPTDHTRADLIEDDRPYSSEERRGGKEWVSTCRSRWS